MPITPPTAPHHTWTHMHTGEHKCRRANMYTAHMHGHTCVHKHTHAHEDAYDGLPLNIHSPLLPAPACRARKQKPYSPDSLSVLSVRYSQLEKLLRTLEGASFYRQILCADACVFLRPIPGFGHQVQEGKRQGWWCVCWCCPWVVAGEALPAPGGFSRQLPR